MTSETTPNPGWVKFSEETFLMLRLMAEAKGKAVPTLLGELIAAHAAQHHFPLWHDGGGGDE